MTESALAVGPAPDEEELPEVPLVAAPELLEVFPAPAPKLEPAVEPTVVPGDVFAVVPFA